MDPDVDKSSEISPWNLSLDAAYLRWREQKLMQAEALHGSCAIEIANLGKPTNKECNEIVRRCAQTNMALYQTFSDLENPDAVRQALRSFASSMDLEIAEKHRSAGTGGIVALTVSDAPGQKGYIPYSRRAMNWHTDGYYNAADQLIGAMVLHCVRPAHAGGQSQFLDPEIAYIRLRDHNPDFIAALMHPEAMTIPENREESGNVRPVSIGPVFSIDPTGDHLNMRYTARTRSISWRQDETTLAAVAFLKDVLESGDPLMETVTLKAGQGILCNNSLHNRTGFDPGSGNDQERLLFRVRFHNRIKEA